MICLVAGLDISAYCNPVGRQIEGRITESRSVLVGVLPYKGLQVAHRPSFTLLYIMVCRLLHLEAEFKGLSRDWGVASIWFGFSSVPRSEPAGHFCAAPLPIDRVPDITSTDS